MLNIYIYIYSLREFVCDTVDNMIALHVLFTCLSFVIFVVVVVVIFCRSFPPPHLSFN